MLTYLGFSFVLTFIESAQFTGSTSLKDPLIFFGLLVGAMAPYLLSSVLIRSIFKTGPAIVFDIRQQIDEIPAIGNGSLDPDFVRTSGLFAFQSMLSLKRFVPLVLFIIILDLWACTSCWNCWWSSACCWVPGRCCALGGSYRAQLSHVRLCLERYQKGNRLGQFKGLRWKSCQIGLLMGQSSRNW